MPSVNYRKEVDTKTKTKTEEEKKSQRSHHLSIEQATYSLARLCLVSFSSLFALTNRRWARQDNISIVSVIYPSLRVVRLTPTETPKLGLAMLSIQLVVYNSNENRSRVVYLVTLSKPRSSLSKEKVVVQDDVVVSCRQLATRNSQSATHNSRVTTNKWNESSTSGNTLE